MATALCFARYDARALRHDCSQWTKATRSRAAAQAMLETDPDSWASRAYDAVFHGVTAVLAGRGMEFAKHTAARAALHRDLIQAGLLPAALGRDDAHFLYLPSRDGRLRWCR